MLAHQLILAATPLQEYVFYAPRTDLLSANREGLLSLIGYFSLQLLGIGIGRYLYSEMLDPDLLDVLNDVKKPLPAQKPDTDLAYRRDVTKRERRLLFRMCIVEALLIAGYLLSKNVFGPPSRRLCNLPYVLY